MSAEMLGLCAVCVAARGEDKEAAITMWKGTSICRAHLMQVMGDVMLEKESEKTESDTDCTNCGSTQAACDARLVMYPKRCCPKCRETGGRTHA